MKWNNIWLALALEAMLNHLTNRGNNKWTRKDVVKYVLPDLTAIKWKF